MGVEDFAILETLRKIEYHLVEIKEYLMRDKLAEMEEQAELTKRYTMKREILTELATQILRDGDMDPRSVLEYSEKLEMEPEKLMKEAREFLEKEQARNL